jgi:hypothetical protein
MLMGGRGKLDPGRPGMKPWLRISVHGTSISMWQRTGTSGEGHYRMPNDVKSNPLFGKKRL